MENNANAGSATETETTEVAETEMNGSHARSFGKRRVASRPVRAATTLSAAATSAPSVTSAVALGPRTSNRLEQACVERDHGDRQPLSELRKNAIAAAVVLLAVMAAAGILHLAGLI